MIAWYVPLLVSKSKQRSEPTPQEYKGGNAPATQGIPFRALEMTEELAVSLAVCHNAENLADARC